MWMPTAYNANHQILQAPGYVTILYKMFHETTRRSGFSSMRVMRGTIRCGTY